MTIRTASVATALLALSIAAFAQGPRRDGNWEIKVQMEMAGMPPGMPPMTSTKCITPEEAKDPEKTVPDMGRGRGNQNCKTTDYKMEGNKATWSLKCEGEMPMTGSGEMVYGADSYTGSLKMETGRGAMTMKYSGKRLGDCVK